MTQARARATETTTYSAESFTAESFGLDPDFNPGQFTSPGEVIKELYMEPLGISGAQLAKAIGKSPSAVNRMLSGDSLTPDMAVRICAVVGGSPAVLLRIELDYRLAKAQAEIDVSQLKPLVAA